MFFEYEHIYTTFYPKIYTYCISRLRDAEYAADCTQNVFLKFFEKTKLSAIDTNIEAWLIIAAKYEILHFIRDNKKYFSYLPLDAAENISLDIAAEEGLIDDIVSKEEKDLLTEYYISGKTSEEIANEKNISAAAVRQQIHRLKKKIKDKLGDYV